MFPRTLAAAFALLACTAAALAQAKTSESVVKATATAKVDGGNRAVTITLDVDPKYHVYANPIGNKDFEDNQTTVVGSGKTKVVKVEYPAGELKKDKDVGDYNIYKGKVVIKATVEGTGPAELGIKVQACTDKSCLLPATIKLSVP